MQISDGGLNAKRQFPKDVFCFDYDPQHSLLAVIGSAAGVSPTSSGNSGMFNAIYFPCGI